MATCGSGHEVPPDAPEGLCPKCLVGLVGLGKHKEREDAPIPARIGPFRILDELGTGGFGRVFRAQRDGSTEIVALKVLRDSVLADGRSLQRFRREPTLSAKLDHRYVVKVLEAGEDNGQPYFAMEYLPGGTLRERMEEYRSAPARAAELMIQIARAVQYLHHDPQHPGREAILHRDLKPENILFGDDGRPRISDFGIAKLVGVPSTGSDTLRMGCPPYMAPEQFYPFQGRALTPAVDVYALGVILYELFTGRVPFDGDRDEIWAGILDREPPPPRRFVPALDRFLETVVLNALEKSPARRYRSATEFVEGLERALRQEVPPVPKRARFWTWVRRRPLTSALCLWGLALACVVGLSAVTLLASGAKTLEREQQLNGSIAGMQAVAVNLQLQAYRQRIALMAEDPAVIALATAEPSTVPSPVLTRYLDPFDTVFVMWTDARQHARTSAKSAEYMGQSFDFRDYFKGARRLADKVCRAEPQSKPRVDVQRAYVARAFVSESDGHFEFAVSAPLCSGSTWVGIVAGTVASQKVLGAVRLLDDKNGRISMVLGPRDRERSQTHFPLPSSPTFMVHPGLPPARVSTLRVPDAAALSAGLGLDFGAEDVTNRGRLRYARPFRIDTYRDPVPGYEGTWAATFAAADDSGYLVAVQSRRDTTPLATALVHQLALPAGLPFLASLFGLAAFAWARRKRELF